MRPLQSKEQVFEELRISNLTQKIAVIGGGFCGAAAVNHLLTFHNRCSEKAGYVLAFQNSGIEWQDMKAVELGVDFPTPPKIKVTMFHHGQFSSIGRGVPFKEDQPEWLCPNFSLDKFSFSDVLNRDPQVPNRAKVRGTYSSAIFRESKTRRSVLSQRGESRENFS